MWFAWWLALVGAPELTLDWEAPPGCPDQQQVRRSVERRWSHDAASVVRVRGRVTAVPAGGFVLRLQIGTEDGEALREITTDDCAALTDAAALVITIAAVAPVAPPPPAIDRVQGLAEPEAPPPGAVGLPEPPTTATVAAPTPAVTGVVGTTAPSIAARGSADARPSAPRRRRVTPPRFAVELAGGVDARAVPGIGGSLLAHAGVHWPRLRVHGVFAYAIDRTVGEIPSARHRVIAGGLELCGLGAVGAWALGGCGSAELGRLHAQGRGGVDLRGRAVPWVALVLGPRVERSFARRFAAFASVGVVVPLSRRRFTIGGRDVGEVAPAGVRGVLGLAVRL